jgi:hypothetical protein
MQTDLGTSILATVLSVLITLIITLVFNKLVTIPAAIKKQKEAHRQELAEMRIEICNLKTTVQEQQLVIDALPGYRQQSLTKQNELIAADTALLTTRQAIQESMRSMQTEVQTTLINLQNGQTELQLGLERNTQNLQDGLNRNNEDLSLLKKSKKDELRIQIINQYHLFTDIQQNPLLAWSEMEFHAFDQLVQDYEHLGGNDFVHDTVLPAINNLEIVSMSNIRRLEEVMSARHAR